MRIKNKDNALQKILEPIAFLYMQPKSPIKYVIRNISPIITPTSIDGIRVTITYTPDIGNNANTNKYIFQIIFLILSFLHITLSSADGNMGWLLWQYERSGPQKARAVTGQL